MLLKKFIKSILNTNDNRGFMGSTHALSALAVFLLITWLSDDFIIRMLGTNSFIVRFVSAIILIGFALFPDYDALRSTIIRVTSPIGPLISKFMRMFSVGVQNLVKTKRDEDDSDPHRKFWHTFISSIIIGILVNLLTSIDAKVVISEKEFTFGFIFSIFILYICLQLVSATIFSEIFKKAKGKKVMHSFIINIMTLVFSIIMLISLPSNINYGWMGTSALLGYNIHLLGDMCTPQGIPFLFPFVIKGKRWFKIRFPFKIKAGSTTEYTVVVPIFLVIIVVSLIQILLRTF